MKKNKLCLWLIVMAAALAAHPAQGRGLSLRAGLSKTPDQAVVGAQIVVGHLLKVARFAPGLDVGFGDDVTTFALNGDVLFPVLQSAEGHVSLYVSTGPTLIRWDVDEGDGDTEIGWSVAAGAIRSMSGRDVGLELRLGVGDVPELKALVGIGF